MYYSSCGVSAKNVFIADASQTSRSKTRTGRETNIEKNIKVKAHIYVQFQFCFGFVRLLPGPLQKWQEKTGKLWAYSTKDDLFKQYSYYYYNNYTAVPTITDYNARNLVLFCENSFIWLLYFDWSSGFCTTFAISCQVRECTQTHTQCVCTFYSIHMNYDYFNAIFMFPYLISVFIFFLSSIQLSIYCPTA